MKFQKRIFVGLMVALVVSISGQSEELPQKLPSIVAISSPASAYIQRIEVSSRLLASFRRSFDWTLSDFLRSGESERKRVVMGVPVVLRKRDGRIDVEGLNFYIHPTVQMLRDSFPDKLEDSVPAEVKQEVRRHLESIKELFDADDFDGLLELEKELFMLSSLIGLSDTESGLLHSQCLLDLIGGELGYQMSLIDYIERVTAASEKKEFDIKVAGIRYSGMVGDIKSHKITGLLFKPIVHRQLLTETLALLVEGAKDDGLKEDLKEMRKTLIDIPEIKDNDFHQLMQFVMPNLSMRNMMRKHSVPVALVALQVSGRSAWSELQIIIMSAKEKLKEFLHSQERTSEFQIGALAFRVEKTGEKVPKIGVKRAELVLLPVLDQLLGQLNALITYDKGLEKAVNDEFDELRNQVIATKQTISEDPFGALLYTQDIAERIVKAAAPR